MRNSDTKFIVLSAELATLDQSVNWQRRWHLMDDLKRAGLMPFRSCVGVYKGINEISYIVDTANNDDAREAIAIAREYEQESVLQVLHSGRAALLYLNTGGERNDVARSVALGHWQEITEDEAAKLDGYTIDGGKYFAALPIKYEAI